MNRNEVPIGSTEPDPIDSEDRLYFIALTDRIKGDVNYIITTGPAFLSTTHRRTRQALSFLYRIY